MEILEQFLFTTTQIHAQKSDGTNSTGTGFFFDFEIQDQDQPKVICGSIITNKHVIADAKCITIYITRRDPSNLPDIGNFLKIDFSLSDLPVFYHPEEDVDLVAMVVAPIFNPHISESSLLYNLSLAEHHLLHSTKNLNFISAISEVYMCGYPIGLSDRKNNLPILRRGITATNLDVDYEGRAEFLIDCACFPGSSGSPVFVYNDGSRAKDGSIIAGGVPEFKLAGILWGGPQFTADGTIKVVDIPTSKAVLSSTNIPSNLGICIKARKILDFKSQIETLVFPTRNSETEK